MTIGLRTLRGKIVAAFCGFALVASLMFVVTGFFAAWVVEDSFLDRIVDTEVGRQQQHWAEHRRLAPPALDFVTLHRDRTSFPGDLAEGLPEGSDAGEVRGAEGRHYHVRSFRLPDGPTAIVVAEVSSQLAVRPMTRELLGLILGLAAAMLLLAAALGYWLALRATRPLSRLADEVAGAAPGEAPRLDMRDFAEAEVSVLAAKLDELLHRTRAFAEREQRFTRDASHELRTPLAVIRSSAELIGTRGPLPAAVERPMRRIIEAALQMQDIVELLLLLAREEKVASAPGEIELLPLVEKIVLEESERLAAQPRVAISIAPERRAAVDRPLARAIIGNIVANALLHAGGGNVRVTAGRDHLLIEDEGPGIDREALAELGDGSGTSGRGLGLTIVRRLCALHGIEFAIRNLPAGGASVQIGI